MRRHGDSEWTVPRPVQRRTAGSADSGGDATDVLLGLQQSVGNAAVAGRLAQLSEARRANQCHSAETPRDDRAREVSGEGSRLSGGAAAGSPMSFVQRCGPTPCNCSAQERADYAEHHPDEPAAAEVDPAAVGPEHG